MRKLVPVKRFAEKSQGAFTESSLRWLIFNANQNGMSAAGVIVRLGRRVLLDEDKFDSWVDQQQPVKAAA